MKRLGWICIVALLCPVFQLLFAQNQSRATGELDSLKTVLRENRSLTPSQKAGLLKRRGELEILTGKRQDADITLTEALQNATGDPQLQMEIRLLLGQNAFESGDFPKAETHLSESMNIAGKQKDKVGEVKALQAFGALYRQTGEWEKSLANLKKARDIQQGQKDHRGLALTFTLTGNTWWKTGKYDKALNEYTQALEIREGLGDPLDIALSLRNIGLVYKELGMYNQATKNYLRALSLVKGKGDPDLEASILNDLGNVHYKEGQWKQALPLYRRCLELRRLSANKQDIAAAHNNIGLILTELNQLPEALTNLDKALSLRRELGLKQDIAITLTNIGNVCKKKRDYSTAMAKYEESNRLREEIGDRLGIVENRIRMGKIYFEQGQYESADRTLGESFDAATELKADILRRECLGLMQQISTRLADRAAAQGDYKTAYERAAEALRRHTLYITVRDTLFSRETARKTTEFQVKYESLKKQEEIDQLALERREQSLLAAQREMSLTNRTYMLYIGGVGLLVLILTAMIFYTRYKVQHRANRRLADANNEIMRVNNELIATQAQLQQMARKDPLTGLSNRREMLEAIERQQFRFERSGKPFTIILGDIDNFKQVNDRFTHEGGDVVLKRVAGIMQGSIRKQDYVARWGGEEFMVMLPETDLYGGGVVTEKIRAEIENAEIPYKNMTLRVTATFGITSYTSNMKIDDCIHRADLALYEGKKAGKNCIISARTKGDGRERTGVDQRTAPKQVEYSPEPGHDIPAEE